ncbi:MAG TPA: TonB-dependent receptor [Saprospiraceae bacterium]|nr:TonB-dependent receptor [Saprospiraceae bacterium]
MRTLLIVLFFCSTATWAFAQNTQKITGTINDGSSGSNLEFATVSLLNASDSNLIRGGVTDMDGRFELSATPGEYLLKAEFIGYQSTLIPAFTVAAGEDLDLGMISLGTEAQVIDALEVRAEKSTMQMALDKRIFNVGKDLASTSGSASEILDNIPSVQVDIEGQVSLRGSSGVRILIDGKPSSLIGVRGASGLQSIPANLIERVEIITNPSSKYEAEGMSGIINIILKKDRKKGINGSFDLSAGTPESFGGSVNLNFRRKQLNFFTNYGYRYRLSPRIGSNYQEFYGATTRIVDQESNRTRGGQSHNLRLGADFFANDKNTITGAFSYRLSNNTNTSDITYRNFIDAFNQDNLTGVSTRNEESEEFEPNTEFSIIHKKTYEKEGQEWTNTVQYQSSLEDQFSRFEELYYDEDLELTGQDNLLQRASNEEAVKSWLIQSDYVYPFGEEGKLEAGYRGSLRYIDNDYLVEEFFDDEWNRLGNLSNDFNYDEEIHALYANVGNKINKFGYQFGLRMEHSGVLTELLQTNEVNDRTYTNLFPSAFLTYEFNGESNVQLSYSRRLRRPRFWDLNPFFTFSDSRNIFRGNPNLDPEFTDAFEASYMKYFNKGSISTSAYYRQSTGVIERIQSLQEENDELVTVRQPENLATEDAYGLEFIYTYEPTDWWRINGSANFFRSIVDGRNFREDLYQDAYTWFTRINSQMKIKDALNVQIRANYRAPRNTTQGRTRSFTTVDLGFNRDILKGRGTLTLSIRDLFSSGIYRSVVSSEVFYSESNFQRRPRQTTLTFNYRLNQEDRRRGGDRRGGDYDGGGDY